MRQLLLAGFLALSSALASNVMAETIHLDAINSGHYTNLGDRNGIESNIFAGASGNVTYRNWLSFNLTDITDEIISASLTVYNHNLNDDGINFTWTEVTTPLYEIYTDQGNGVAKFNDLGNGTEFASGVTVSGVDNEFTLNEAALASLNIADSLWVIGGSAENDAGSSFGFTNGVGSGDLIQLTIETRIGVVPVPPALWLFATGLLGLVAVARRRT